MRLLPRLTVLDAALATLAPEASVAIVILTVGARRAASLRQQLPATGAAVVVGLLPSAVGRPAVDALVEVLRAE